MDEERFIPTCLNEGSTITRSITGEVSPIFNWEDTATISLFGVNGNVILPWYSGAIANIPFFILDDYKAADGWKMIYNTCTKNNNSQDGQYYLIFYNIFTGKMRTFVYNKNDVTNGDITFWQLTFNTPTALLNDLEPYTLPVDTITNLQEIFVSNLSSTPTKSLTRGWNTFETDFMVYDPTIVDKNIAMSISAYDINRENLEVVGDVDLYSKGTMVTTTNITTASTPKILNSAVTLLGDKAEEKFKKWFPDKKSDKDARISSALIASSVKGIVKAGGNFLVKKFFGRESTQTLVSNSDIKISTDGKIVNKGAIVSQQQSNVSPISMLPLPGSKVMSSNFLLPSYDAPMGVWHLESSPIVSVDCRQYIYAVGELRNAFVIGYLMQQKTLSLEENQPKVVINPAIFPYLDNYTVSYDFQFTQEASSLPPRVVSEEMRKPIYNSPNGVPFSNIVTYTPVRYGDYFLSPEDNLLVRYPVSNCFVFTSPGTIQQMMFTKQMYKDLNGMRIKCNGVPHVEVKVTVILYPKSPFNTEPIISTRTFKPKYIGVQ